jgi:hypothetical protein
MAEGQKANTSVGKRVGYTLMFKVHSYSLSWRWKAFGLLTLVLVGTNSPVFVGGRTLLPIAPSYGVMPPVPYGYTGPVADSSTTIDPAGSLNVGYAFDAYTARTLKQGTIPFWNPYQGLGQPFLANAVSSVLYPPNWLYLFLPPAWWDMVYLLNWLLAAFFLFIYLHLMGLKSEVALIGGVAVLGSGFFQIYLPLREVPAVAAWWPLLLYGIERSLATPTWRYRHLILAGAIFCTVAGGQPEVTFVSLSVALVYALVRLAMIPSLAWSGFMALAPGGLIGLMLAAPTWVDFAHYAFAAHSFHLPGSKVGLGHLYFETVSTYLFPYIYGRMHTAPFGAIAGWDWGCSPGWFPMMGVFLALASLRTVLKKPSWGLALLLVGIGTAAKIWGLPVINSLGSLPLFDRVAFCRYAAFLLTFALAGLAAYGVNTLSHLEARLWAPWLGAWFTLVLVTFDVGIRFVWPTLGNYAFSSLPIRIVGAFGALGLGWAIVAPLGLWWVRYRRSDEAGWIPLVGALAILLQGIAYAPHGYTNRTYVILSLACLHLYLFTVVVIGFTRRVRRRHILIVGLTIVTVTPLTASSFAYKGLPARYNPLTPAPYLTFLRNIQGQYPYRSYSFDGTPQPNFAAPFGFTSLNNIEALLPPATAEFTQRYLDRGVSPLWFAGNLSWGRKTHLRALDEFWKNKRFFDLVGVRYVVTQATDPLPFVYDTAILGLKAAPEPLLRSLETRIPCPTDNLSAIQILLSTYGRQNSGKVILRVFGPSGTLLRYESTEGAGLVNNSFSTFEFPAIKGLKGQQILLRLAFEPYQPSSMIAAWVYPDRPSLGFAFRILDKRDLLSLVYEDSETKVRVWENPQALPRAFLAPVGLVAPTWQEVLPRLQDSPDLSRYVWIDQGPPVESTWPQDTPTGKLISFRLGPNDVWMTYQADTAGILTLTDSYAEGWHAELNGREVPVLRVDGAFRGVRIEKPGTYDLHFRYRPPYWNLSLGLAGIGLLLITGATLLQGRR